MPTTHTHTFGNILTHTRTHTHTHMHTHTHTHTRTHAHTHTHTHTNFQMFGWWSRPRWRALREMKKVYTSNQHTIVHTQIIYFHRWKCLRINFTVLPPCAKVFLRMFVLVSRNVTNSAKVFTRESFPLRSMYLCVVSMLWYQSMCQKSPTVCTQYILYIMFQPQRRTRRIHCSLVLAVVEEVSCRSLHSSAPQRTQGQGPGPGYSRKVC